MSWTTYVFVAVGLVVVFAIVFPLGWRPPHDGGSGREARTRWTVWRFFSWRHGSLSHRFKHRFVTARWTLKPDHFSKAITFGFHSYEDDDGDRVAFCGLWPWCVEITVADWERPPRKPAPAASDRQVPDADGEFGWLPEHPSPAGSAPKEATDG